MPPKPTKSSTSQMASAAPKDYETLVRLVSERVWVLWQEDMRRNRERGGKIPRR